MSETLAVRWEFGRTSDRGQEPDALAGPFGPARWSPGNRRPYRDSRQPVQGRKALLRLSQRIKCRSRRPRSLYRRQFQAAEPQGSGSLLARWIFARPSSHRIKFRADIGKDSL